MSYRSAIVKFGALRVRIFLNIFWKYFGLLLVRLICCLLHSLIQLSMLAFIGIINFCAQKYWNSVKRLLFLMKPE